MLLSILYDTGGRVQELIDLSVGDVRLDPPAQLRVLGKGRKMRAVPLMASTVQLLRDHIQEKHHDSPEQFCKPLFPDRAQPTPFAFRNPLYPQKISRQSPEQTFESELAGESTYLSAHKRYAPFTEWGLARNDQGFPGTRRCQDNSNLRNCKPRNEAKRP